MKTFLLSTCFLFLFLSRFCVSVTPFSSVYLFSAEDADRGIPYEDDSNNHNIDEEEEEFKDIREGFGEIADPEEDEDEEGFLEEDEEEEKKFDIDTSQLSPVDVTRSNDSSGHSSRQGCFCSNETSNVVCECFGDSIKSVPKNLTSVSRL